ncbi:MAG: CARDB domain-containing protein [Phototrophicaceae bacterium]
MRRQLFFPCWFLVWAVLGCNLTLGQTLVSTATPTVMVDESVLPTVKINSPAQGSQAQQGSPLLVSAVATDAVGITRVQLLANNQLVKTVSSESVNGDPEMSVVLDYIPRLTGNVELRVVAFRGTIASEPSVLTVQVVTELTDSVEVIQNNSGQVAANGVNANDPTCRILTNVDLNYRTGPGTTYQRVGTFPAGRVVPIIGRLADNSWWQVRDNLTDAWVSAQYVTVYGICTAIPIVRPLPSPTPNATVTATALPATNTPQPIGIPNTATSAPTLTLIPTLTTTAQPPDLAVVSITGSNAVSLSGGSVSVTYSVQITNLGGRDSGQFTTTFTVFPLNVTRELATVGNLRAGESIILNTNVLYETAQQYTLQALADSASSLTESNEVNNVSALVVTVSSN